jgi:uncharacterized repeat protein (TIGR01451 family)
MSRAGRIAIERNRYVALLSVLLAAILLVLVPRIALSQGLASYSSVSTNSANFTAGVVTGTITISNRTNVSSASGLLSTTISSATNFPGSWYSPTTPAASDFRAFELNNADSASTGSYTVTYQFNTPVTNPVFHFVNLDAGSYNFSSTTQVDGSAVSVSRLSGNNEFEVTSSLVNSTTRTPSNTGCEANNGSNGEGGCGSIQLTGIYQTVTFVATDNVLSTASGDGHGIALFVYSDYGDAPSSYGGAAHSGSTAIRLGALRDVESANQPNAAATLDDNTGSDDEDALSSVSGVTLTAGATHTQSGISCTGTGSLYGYIDFNRDGDFADTGERSSLSSCSGGTASLSWTQPSTTGSLVSGSSFLRIRYASDSSQIDSPTENAATGEVEDYAVTLTNASANFAVTKSDGIASISSGSSTTYTIVVTNNGPATVAGAVLTDAAATGITKTSVACASTPGQCTGGTTPTIAQLEAGYALPSLASGETYRLSLTATVTATSGSVSNTATIAVPVGVTDGTSSNNTATDTDTVTARVAGTAPTLSCSAGTTTLDWDSVSWTSGSTSQSYSVSNLGSVSLNVALSGGSWITNSTYGGTSPTRQNVDTGGYSPAQYSLMEFVDMSSRSGTATTTVTLPTAVPGAQFRVMDVDFSSSSFADKITVIGSFNGSPVTPTLTNGVSNYVIGNSAYGDSTSGDTSGNGNVVVTFAAPVDTITIVYGNHTTAPSNPTQQAIMLHDFTFCRPIADIDVTKVSSVISDPINNTTDPKLIPGALLSYCILVTNNGSGTATSVVASDNLPSNITYVPGSLKTGTNCANATTAEDDNSTGADETDPVGAAVAGTTVTGTAPTLAVDSSFVLVFNATVN